MNSEKTLKKAIDIERLTSYQQKRGVNKSALARLSGLDRTTIMVAFRNKQATMRTIKKITSVLNITPNDILTSNVKAIVSNKNNDKKEVIQTDTKTVKAHYINDESFGEQIFARNNEAIWVATKGFPMVGSNFSKDKYPKLAKSIQIFKIMNPKNKWACKYTFLKVTDINGIKKKLIPAIADKYCEFVKNTAKTIPEDREAIKKEEKKATATTVLVQNNTIVMNELKNFETRITNHFQSLMDKIDKCIETINKQSESMMQGYVNIFNGVDKLNNEIKRYLETPDRIDKMLSQLSGIEKPIDNAAKISDSVKKIAALQREMELMRYSINELSAQIISNKAKAA